MPRAVVCGEFDQGPQAEGAVRGDGSWVVGVVGAEVGGGGLGGVCVFHTPIMRVGYSDVNTLPTKYEARQIEQQVG